MLISTKGRYALRVLIDIAEQPQTGYIPLKAVAARQEVSEKYLESILKTLVKSGVLMGLRGKGGGYKLAIPPEKCTIDQILRLTEDSMAPVACLETGYPACPRAADCRTLPLWQGLEKVITEYLGSITLADLIRHNDRPSSSNSNANT